MNYSLMAGGKRIRPILTMEFCAACGDNPTLALDIGCAVEMLHTYSLIHDDLPCMDNDDLRRGKPTNHKVYGEWLAMLAGDALQAEAFYTIANCGLHSAQIMEAVKVLGHAAGQRGICGGQYLDLDGEGKERTVSELFTTHGMKTAALIEAACVLGCIAANADEEKISNARKFALNLGLAFQITDDILDFISEEKSSDEIKGKSTYTSIFGLEKAKEIAAEYTEKAISALEFFGENANEIRLIAEQLLNRNN